MRQAWIMEWQWLIRFSLPFLIISTFVFPFILNIEGSLLVLTIVLLGVLPSQVLYENQSNQLEWSLSLPIKRSDWVNARFFSYNVQLISTFFILLVLYVIGKNVSPFGLSISEGTMPFLILWLGGMLILLSLQLYFFLRFPFKTAWSALSMTYIVLFIISFLIMFRSSSGTMTISAHELSVEIGPLQMSPWVLSIILLTVGLFMMTTSYYLTKRHLAKVSSGIQ